MIGQTVGGQTITAKLGEGGMGVVYAAEDEMLGRPTALKMLRPEMSAHKEVVQRFFHEAKAAAALRHPGIVEIYSFGYHDDGSAYLVMEFLEGQSLEARLTERSKLPVPEAIRITRQVCSALKAAHTKDIVHRDLKPDNIFLVPDPDIVGGERIKLLDFGIAKLGGDAKSSGFATSTGAVFGTPAFMAPEQCRGAGGVDPRADLYAVGCILFRMVCSRVPFEGEFSGEIIAMQLRDPPPEPRKLDPTIPADLEAVILRLLEKNPEDRYASAQDLREALDALDDAPARPSASVPIPIMSTLPGVPASKPEHSSVPAPAKSTPEAPADTDSNAVGPVETAEPPQTTLGAASGESLADADRASRSKAPLYALAGLAAAGAIVAAVVIGTSGDKTAKNASNDATNTTTESDPCKTDADACFDQARQHELGGSAELDYGRAALLYRRACELGAARGCVRAGLFAHSGVGSNVDNALAQELFAKACNDETSLGCAHVEASGAERENLLNRGCEGGHPWACHSLAMKLRTLVANAPDSEREDLGRRRQEAIQSAREKFREQCDQGIARDCLMLSELLGGPTGEGLEPMRRACEGGDADACWRVGEGERGDDMANRACEAGHARYCERLGQRFASGKAGDDKRKDAAKFYKRACNAGLQDACNALARLNGGAPTEPLAASHILIKVDKRSDKEARKLAASIAKKAQKDPKRFAKLAKQYSEGPTAKRGGDLGVFDRGRMVKPFEEAVQVLEVGQVSDPVRTRFGWHVILRNPVPGVDKQREDKTASAERGDGTRSSTSGGQDTRPARDRQPQPDRARDPSPPPSEPPPKPASNAPSPKAVRAHAVKALAGGLAASGVKVGKGSGDVAQFSAKATIKSLDVDGETVNCKVELAIGDAGGSLIGLINGGAKVQAGAADPKSLRNAAEDCVSAVAESLAKKVATTAKSKAGGKPTWVRAQ